MQKRIISFITAMAAAASVSAQCFAMNGAIYGAETGIEVLRNVSTTSKNNWQPIGKSVVMADKNTESIRVLTTSDAEFGAEMSAGGDLYKMTRSAGAMSWNFENGNDDIFVQKGDNQQLTDPAAAPEDKWAGFYTTKAYWTSPGITEIGKEQYSNSATGDEYTGVKTPAAEGSTKCVSVGLGGNDWHYESLGIKVKLSADKIKPGETYLLSYYVMDNTASRDLYASFTKPSLTEPNPNGGGDDWYKSSEPVGKTGLCWSSGSVEIIPTEADFENGYTNLWLGTRGTKLSPRETIYFDNIILISKNDIKDNNLSFSTKIKSDARDIKIVGTLMDNEIFSKTITATGEDDFEEVSVDFSLKTNDPFYLGESRGSDMAHDKFKISFITENKGTFYIKDVSINNPVEPSYFTSLDTAAGGGAMVLAKIYSSGGDAKAFMSVVDGDAERAVTAEDISLKNGENSVLLKGTIPTGLSEGAYLAVYIEDADGKLISERKQKVADIYKNGADILGGTLTTGNALEIFGAGTYLVEFTTSDDVESAEVSIGSKSAQAAISNGYGVCEIELDAGNNQNVSVSGVTAENITLKKVLD